MYDPRIGRWLSEDPIGFVAADPNLYRYVRNDPRNATDPTGLLELKGTAVNYIQQGGQPGYEIKWNVIVDPVGEIRPKSATQVWIITKIEKFSVYKEGDGKWRLDSKPGEYTVTYIGDFVDIGQRKAIGDTSRLGFLRKRKLKWAIYYEKVTKTLGYNPRGGEVKEQKGAILSEKQANDYLQKMVSSTKDTFGYQYLAVDKDNRAACGINIEDSMPAGMRKDLEKLAEEAKDQKAPQEFDKASGFYLYSFYIPDPKLRYEPKK